MDEYALLIHSRILGAGRRLFPEGTPFATLRLTDNTVTTTSVVIATYRPAEPASRTSDAVDHGITM